MAIHLYYSQDLNFEAIQFLTGSVGIKATEIRPDMEKDREAKVLVCSDRFFRQNDGASPTEGIGAIFLVLNHETDLMTLNLPEGILFDYSVGEINLGKLHQLIQSADLRDRLLKTQHERDAHLHRLKELNNIGVALSTEKDPVRLLEMILQKSREITFADAGSLYLVEGDDESHKQLRFKISQNDSVNVDYEEFLMPLSKNSIAGYVALTGEDINISDVYRINSNQEYHFNRQFDQRTGYRSVSMLAVPMKNHKGEIIGIIQLINRKKNFSTVLNAENYEAEVQPFDLNDEELVNSLASQAAVALENSTLIKSIQRLFEGFVTASVTAIESRDPTTSGHSFRVANLLVGLATLVDRSGNGRFREVTFTADEIKEMRYAALLHDFGKVGVRENVLVKAKKLYPLQMELIRQRFAYLQKTWEAEFYKSQLQFLLTEGRENFDRQRKELENVYRDRLNSLEDYLEFIESCNEPTVLPAGNFDRLLTIAANRELIAPESGGPLLTPDEVHLLCIRKGNLNDLERMEIQSHVTHTFLFLSKIPWTSELKQVPKFAYGHHEKLDGSGYPNQLKGDEIPVQTRMMTISDIYDALTASDRPYKRAVPSAKALDIIAAEVEGNQLDSELFQIFLEGKVYQLATGKR